MKKRILVALGGNAIKKPHERGTIEEQLRNVKKTCLQLIKLIKMGYELVITHGNGPQVGNLMIQQEEAIRKIPPQPLDVLGAMTQGQIGYMLQQTLQNLLKKEGINKQVITVITQVLVRKDDPDFKSPSKPVGPFYTEDEVKRLKLKERGYTIKRVKPGDGKVFRIVVPSPDPIDIIEGEAIKKMVEEGMIVIACGGGGIPVIMKNKELKGVEAVIDKDLASEKLAEIVNANILLILTDIDKVKLNYGKPNEKPIDKMTVKEARKYLSEGHFLPGSMEPKIIACIRFIEWGGEKAVIAALDQALEALIGKAGTQIYRG